MSRKKRSDVDELPEESTRVLSDEGEVDQDPGDPEQDGSLVVDPVVEIIAGAVDAVDSAPVVVKGAPPAAKDSALADMPTADALRARGFSAEETDTIRKGWALFVKGPGFKLAAEGFAGAHYRVTCGAKGMWRIGRQFTNVPTVLPVDSLTAEECQRLEASNTKFFKVEKINF